MGQTIEVSGVFDGKLRRFSGSGNIGDGGQSEEQKPLFVLKDGAVLKNVVLGERAADGVHCLGSCTLQNVWWEDVGEDAATFKGTAANAVYKVHGGGARNASDKVFQFNGSGKLVVNKFQVGDFGKLVRSCGNCRDQKQRTVLLNNIDVTGQGRSLVGINTNYGDTASLRNIRLHGKPAGKVALCDRYQGNSNGSEPKHLGTGPDGKHCNYSPSDISRD